MMKKRVRQTQDARTAQMRERILEATLQCIYEDGFYKASTNTIVKRAGVSRGALLHHFPSKDQLIADAVDHLLKAEINDIRRVAAEYSAHRLTIDDFIEDMWTRFSGRLFLITMDFLAGARTDEKLREALKPVNAEFHNSLNDIWTKFFANDDLSDKKIQVLLNGTLCLLRGMGLQTVLRQDEPYFSELREMWKSALHLLLADEQVARSATGQRDATN